MSDEEVQTKQPAKRGRKPNPAKAKKEDKAVKNGDDSGDAPPVKRGRGRPKGNKKPPAKSNGSTAASRRGRSKKEDKDDSSAEENGKGSAEEEEEDDE